MGASATLFFLMVVLSRNLAADPQPSTVEVGSRQQSWTITHPVFEPVLQFDRTIAMQYFGNASAQLVAFVTTEGGKDHNKRMINVMYDYARIYHLMKAQPEGDVYAQKGVALLKRFAEVVPLWPYWSRDGVQYNNASAVDLSALTDNHGGLWWDTGDKSVTWYCLTLRNAEKIILSYDLLFNSNAYQSLSSQEKKTIEDDLLRYLADFQFRYYGGIPTYDNLVGYYLDMLIPFGRILDPKYIHYVVDYATKMAYARFFRDGVWCEGSPSYHEQVVYALFRNNSYFKSLPGYSDPPGYLYLDGTRYDSLNLYQNVSLQVQRILNSMYHLSQPVITYSVASQQGRFYGFHDTHSQDVSFYIKNRTVSEPYCYFGLRHCILGQFSDPNQVRAHLHFGGWDGHDHGNMLNLGLWALQEDLFSETEYREFYGSPREWNWATPSHNTVMIDSTDHRVFALATLTQDDMVDGLPTYTVQGKLASYAYQSNGQGNTVNAGRLVHFDPKYPKVQLVEAAAPHVYNGGWDFPYTHFISCSAYQRSIVLVSIDNFDTYTIDLFRVKGGTKSLDWMLHGPLRTVKDFRLYGTTPPASAYENYEFSSSLSLAATNELRYNKRYSNENSPHFLTLFGTNTTSSTWWSEWRVNSSQAHVRTIMIGCNNTEVSFGTGLATRRAGNATFLNVRRLSQDTTFVAVHEPYKNSNGPRIISIVSLLPTANTLANSTIVLKIELSDNRTDYYASSINDSTPYYFPSENFGFAASSVHVRTTNGAVEWVHLTGGSWVVFGHVNLTAAKGTFNYRGSISQISRNETGGTWNGFVTNVSLPSDGSLHLVTILLELSPTRTEAYTIRKVVRDGPLYQIHVTDEPGMEIRNSTVKPGKKVVKLMYYPSRAFELGSAGEIPFSIAGIAHWDSSGNVYATAALATPSASMTTAAAGTTAATAATIATTAQQTQMTTTSATAPTTASVATAPEATTATTVTSTTEEILIISSSITDIGSFVISALFTLLLCF